MDWHRRLGLVMVGLVLFRLIWGFIGTWTARFLPMLRRLRSLKSYLGNLRNKDRTPTFGHSPLGILSVFALLLALATQVTTGLFSVDVDGLESGPLAVLVTFDTGRQFADIHEFNFNILAGLIGLHIIAIATYHFVLKEKLVKPMITGRRARADFSGSETPEARMPPLSTVVAAIIALICVWGISTFG